MLTVKQEHKDIFRSVYDRSKNNINEVLLELRKEGVTQAACTLMLIRELGMSLAEADKIVLTAPAWQDVKDINIRLTDEFGNYLESLDK